MSGHTPGPWEAFLPLSDYPNDWRVRSDDYGEIASLHEDYTAAKDLSRFEEIEANARLISAAPEMLDALHRIVRDADQLDALADLQRPDYGGPRACDSEAIKAARAAIVKAEGGAS